MNRELVSNIFLLNFFAYFYFISLAYRTTQTPAASSPTAKTTSLRLAD